MFVVHHPDTTILGGDPVGYPYRVIGRGVIGDYDLKVRHRLSKSRVQSALKIVFSVVGGYDNAYVRRDVRAIKLLYRLVLDNSTTPVLVLGHRIWVPYESTTVLS